MEGKKYWLIGFMLIWTVSLTAQNSYKQRIYKAYIAGNMGSWKTTIDQMEEQKTGNPDFLLDLVNYEYGYIAWCIGNDSKDEARKYLELAEENLEKLKNADHFEAEYHAYTAAFYGFKIGLSLWRAPFYGPKSMNEAETALKTDSSSFNANMELGNIWSNMPEMFGGSDEKALKYYLRALEILENKDKATLKSNWMYINLLTLIGQTEQKLNNLQQAKLYYEKALTIEPDFVWVKNELLPTLKQELN